MRKCILSILIATIVAIVCGGLIACSKDSDDSLTKTERLQVVAIPDITFLAGEKSLSSTFFEPVESKSRAEIEEVFVRNDELFNVDNNINVRLTVAEDEDDYIAFKHWTAGDYRAAKVSIFMYTPTDLTLFMPIEAQHFCYNGKKQLEAIAKSGYSTLPTSTQGSHQLSKLTKNYGEAALTFNVDDNSSVVATVSFGMKEDGTEGVELSIVGVTQSVLSELERTYNEGLTVEVLVYFKNTISRSSMRSNFNEGATVAFSNKPAVYGNVFTKVKNYLQKVYGKEDIETGMLIPYKDAELTQKLESRYWVRPAQEDGTPSFDYLLTCHRYEWDCTVSYSGVEYKKMLRNDASVPDDVETKFYVLPNNYNVYYFDDMP